MLLSEIFTKKMRSIIQKILFDFIWSCYTLYMFQTHHIDMYSASVKAVSNSSERKQQTVLTFLVVESLLSDDLYCIRFLN